MCHHRYINYSTHSREHLNSVCEGKHSHTQILRKNWVYTRGMIWNDPVIQRLSKYMRVSARGNVFSMFWWLVIIVMNIWIVDYDVNLYCRENSQWTDSLQRTYESFVHTDWFNHSIWLTFWTTYLNSYFIFWHEMWNTLRCVWSWSEVWMRAVCELMCDTQSAVVLNIQWFMIVEDSRQSELNFHHSNSQHCFI